MLRHKKNGRISSVSHIDITNKLSAYRQASCELWNSYFLPATGAKIDFFDQIERLLFQSIVGEGAEKVEMFLSLNLQAGPVKLLINRIDSNSVNRWDETLMIAEWAPFRFRFLEFFDWDQRAVRKMDLVRIEVTAAASASRPGKYLALLEWKNVERVFVQS